MPQIGREYNIYSASQIVLVGPQTAQWTQDRLIHLQHNLRDDCRFEFLVDVLAALPQLWPKVQGIEPTDVALIRLQALRNFAFGETGLDAQDLTNAQSAPLTVVSQVIDWTQQRGESKPWFTNVFEDVVAVQGFCLGFLFASVLSTVRSQRDYKKYVGNSIRLAACIGLVVDAKAITTAPATAISVRCKSVSEQACLDACLDLFREAYISCITDAGTRTVTLPARDLQPFTDHLKRDKIESSHIDLSGYYHHPRHSDAAETLKQICGRCNDLQLPMAETLHLPLRSTADTQVITSGSLHSAAIDLILCHRAHWFQTLKRTMDILPSATLQRLGKEHCIPRSLSKSKNVNGCDTSEFGNYVPDEIAIIGTACRFPRAESLHELWELLVSGGIAVDQLPIQRYDRSSISREPLMEEIWGNFLRCPEGFDHRFFGVSGREAKSMDPQQRLSLQVAYEALESSGYFSQPVNGRETDIGCYFGVSSSDYDNNVASEGANAFSVTGTSRAFISGRISHFFGWHGPSITFDTACSSSAVAIHTACKAILGGECNMALAGGVNVITSPELHQNLTAASFLHRNGPSRAFDASAGGYCRGEGAGVLVLKRFCVAQADGDTILGVISGSAVNQNSNASAITVPDSLSQASLYQRALSAGHIEAKDVTYVEAHGTGTQVGDPIEYESVRLALLGPQRNEDLFLGSVKDNIGHAEAASGVAGVLKVLLMFQHRVIPQQANFVTLNPLIKSDSLDRITIPRTSQPWAAKQLVAMVNNYGAAGNNASLVLREHVVVSDLPADKQPDLDTYPVFLAASSKVSLQAYMDRLKHHLRAIDVPLAETTRQLALRANPSLEYRAAFSVGDASALIASLDGTTNSSNKTVITRSSKRPIVLVFGGQTGQKVTISREVYESCDVFRRHLDRCNEVSTSLGFPEILPTIFKGDKIDDIVQLHCLLLSLQISCARSWLDSGVEVDTLIGHSFGHLSALCVSGCISLEDSFRLVAGRARLIEENWGHDPGAMLSLTCSRDDMEALVCRIRSTPGCHVDVACYNGPQNFVLAGSISSIEKAQEYCHSIKTTKLRNTHAYHSHLADSILGGLKKLARTLTIKTPQIRVEACSDHGMQTSFTADSIADHTRLPVYFSDSLERIASRLPSAIWLEAGSSTPVITMIRRTLSQRSETDSFIAMELQGVDTMRQMANVACQLWNAGSGCHYWPFQHKSGPTRTVFLPPYQFEQTRHWIDHKPRFQFKSAPPLVSSGGLVSMLNDDQGSGDYLFAVNTSHVFYDLAVRGHAVGGRGLCPASAYLELATRCAMAITENELVASELVPLFQNVTMSTPLGCDIESGVFLRLRHTTARSYGFTVYSSPSTPTPDERSKFGPETEHANGSIDLLCQNDAILVAKWKLVQTMARTSRGDRVANSTSARGINGDIIYKLLSQVVNYAAYYQGVKRIAALDNEAVGFVTVPSGQRHFEATTCRPLAVDTFLQVAGIHVNCLSTRNPDEVFMCNCMEEIIFDPTFTNGIYGKSRNWTVCSRYETMGRGTLAADIFIYDATSKSLTLAIIGARFRSVPLAKLAQTLAQLGKTLTESPYVSATDSGYQSPVTTQPSQDVQGMTSQREECIQDMQCAREAEPQAPTRQTTILYRLRELLSGVIEIPVEDVDDDSTLDYLGIDSLLVTEILYEIQRNFQCEITQVTLQGCRDVLSLSRYIESTLKIKPTPGPASSSSPTTTTIQPTLTADIYHDGAILMPSCKESITLVASERFEHLCPLYDECADATGLSGFYAACFPIQSRLVLLYVVNAFAVLGCDLRNLNPGDNIPTITYHKRHEKLIPQLYKIIEHAGLITEDGHQGFHRTTASMPDDQIDSLRNQLFDDFPKHACEIQLLHITASRLADCLSGSINPLSLIFEDSTTRSLLEDVYTNAPMFKTGTLFLDKYLLSVVSQFTNSNRELKILEIGAGTGGTTKQLVSSLAGISESGVKLSYMFTDSSPSLVAAARRKFSHIVFMSYRVLDIEKMPERDLECSFDIVISSNCVHATRDLVNTTTNIRKMLREGGILCLIELTRNLFWLDLVFGLLDGWWLFSDGRRHALADEQRWKSTLRESGFKWIDWTGTQLEESNLLRVIMASPCGIDPNGDARHAGINTKQLKLRQTVLMKQIEGLDLFADIFYPPQLVSHGQSFPVALMIHGGGHIMLSRHDIQPDHINMLLLMGFIPISIDYRLCPEVTLSEGPMEDVADALAWVREVLPTIQLSRADIGIDATRVVAVGWSTGGLLALSLGWTSISRKVQPPQAILSFYSPTDYEDTFWVNPNYPIGADINETYNLHEIAKAALRPTPISSYTIPPADHVIAGWLSTKDPRSRLAVYMNIYGRSLHVLLRKLDISGEEELAMPTKAEIAAVSPLAQIRAGKYISPTFIIHPREDDLVPWQQAQRTWEALRHRGIDAELRILEDVPHLFDIYKRYRDLAVVQKAMKDGYEFLRRHVS